MYWDSQNSENARVVLSGVIISLRRGYYKEGRSEYESDSVQKDMYGMPF